MAQARKIPPEAVDVAEATETALTRVKESVQPHGVQRLFCIDNFKDCYD